jgi:hypothetical protein
LTLTWSGAGVEPGRRDVRLEGEEAEVEVEASGREEGVTDTIEGIDVVDVDGRAVEWRPEGPNPWRLFAGGDEFGLVTAPTAEAWRAEFAPFGGRTVTVVLGSWKTSRPLALPSSGRGRVALHLGGYVLVHLRRPLPEEAGPLRLEREDGGWLGRAGGLRPPSPDDEGSPVSAGDVETGTLLGPLPPGDVPLRVLLGGVEVGRVVAKVVAGEVSVLSLR